MAARARKARFDAVFFDLDGTLWDNEGCLDRILLGLIPRIMEAVPDASAADIILAFNAAFLDMVHAYGIQNRRALSRTERFERLLAYYGVTDAAMAQELADRYTSAFQLYMRNFLARDAVRVLGSLRHAQVTLGVITNGVPAVKLQTLEGLGLSPYLDHVIISGLVGFQKPDRRIFEHALKVAGTSAERTLYVGDNPIVDVGGAQRAGMKTAWLVGAKQPPRKALPAADHRLESLADLLRVVL